MIRITTFLACFLASICLSQTAFGWGQEGHMTVAEIAYNHLRPDVKAQCDALIAVNLGTYTANASSNFITAASWADDFKSSLGTGTSHYIDLPLCINGLAVSNTGTCTGTCNDGVCTNNAPPGVPNVVTAINQYTAVLLNPNASLTDRATALRYVLHYVGDIQQPLHSSNGISTSHPPPNGDAGGNGFSIHGTWSNLHSMWDAGVGYLNDSGISRPMSASGYATISNKVADVETTYPYTPSIGAIPDPMTWATDSYYYAETVTYANITEGGTPTTSYLNAGQATCKQRMAAGGKRLADLLMTIFATNAASFTASPTNGAASLNVAFTDTSTGSITNWFWNFGDGNTTNFTASTNPSHTYAAGTYTATLIVSGYPGSSTNTASITAGSSTTLPPPQITSIIAQDSDIRITWSTFGGTTNTVQATIGTPDFNTNFSDIAGPLYISGTGDTSTNFTDPGAVTNSPAKYYRIRLVP
jgi:PKD repeat protein